MLNRGEEFDAVYEKYWNLIMRVAYNHVKNYHTAQDICQEVFSRLYLYFDSMPAEKIKAWLIVVASNCAKDYLKKGGKYTEVSETMAAELTAPENADSDPDAHAKQLEARELLSTSLMKLREKNAKWYDILVLVIVMEVPRKKVALEYGESVSAIDGHLKRARKWMWDNFGEEYRAL